MDQWQSEAQKAVALNYSLVTKRIIGVYGEASLQSDTQLRRIFDFLQAFPAKFSVGEVEKLIREIEEEDFEDAGDCVQ